MFVRTTRVEQNGKVYEYPQLVRSFRRESDGRSDTEVICSLKDWTELEIENLKRALQASREGYECVLAPESTGQLDGATVTANLQFLDVAVLSGIWQQWGLDALFAGLAGEDDSEVPLGDVVKSLVFHRCVEPGSKLAATRWFGSTALPELLEVEPSQFNNSRLHRVLEKLDALEEPLLERLPEYLDVEHGASRTFYLDVTDTWFEGRGGQLAERSKTKEGLTRKKVGIVLMCNEAGYPTAWEVVAGRTADKPAMVELLDDVHRTDWFDQIPLVVDRAMGTTAAIDELVDRDIRFVTALRRNEYPSYTDEIPTEPFVDLEVDGEQAVERVAERIDSQGFTKLEETLYVRDLGSLRKEAPGESNRADHGESVEDVDNRPAKYLDQADRINEGLEQGKWSSLSDVGRAFGYSKAWASDRSILRRIAEDIQQDLRAGAAPHLGLEQLKELSRLPVREQRTRYQKFKQDRSPQSTARSVDRRNHPAPSEQAQNMRPSHPLVRGVVCFNPEQFVDQRREANRQLGQIYRKVSRLNARAREGRLEADQLIDKLEAKLEDAHLLDAFEIDVEGGESRPPQLSAQLREAAWQRRRRYDGFSVLVAAPELEATAAQLARLYRDKNTVEVDFRTIKSFAELRPVYHQTDAKIRAHVTICMLAVLLERTLTERLESMETTGKRALEMLGRCHLNRVEFADQPETPLYTLTRPTPDQRNLVEALGMGKLLDEPTIQEEITPR